jgi:ribosomal protein L40E
MANFFYFDQTGQKFGPVSEEQLRELATQGSITPQTPMETDTGHKGVAGQIPGLFATAQPSAPKVNPSSAPPTPANLFCTHCGKPVAEQATACMSCGFKPTGHKEFCRQCGAKLDPKQVVCIKCGTKVSAGTFDSLLGADKIKTLCTADNIKAPLNVLLSADTPKSLHTLFTMFWMCIAGGLMIIFGGLAVTDLAGNVEDAGILLGLCTLAGFLGLIGGVILCLVLLHKLWKQIPKNIARIDPADVIKKMLIPPANFYWLFVVVWGLGKDMNKALQQRGLEYRVNERLGLAFCIFLFLFLIIAYYLGDKIIALMAIIMIGSAVWIFYFKSLTDGAIALMKHNSSEQQKTESPVSAVPQSDNRQEQGKEQS